MFSNLMSCALPFLPHHCTLPVLLPLIFSPLPPLPFLLSPSSSPFHPVFQRDMAVGNLPLDIRARDIEVPWWCAVV